MDYIFRFILLVIISIHSLNASFFSRDDDNTCTQVEKSIEVRVSSRNDDAEERLSNGDMYRSSSDLELTEDGHAQIVGIRFQSINIPKDATITKAYIQFEVDEASSISTDLTIYGEDTDNSSYFSSTDYDISHRTKTSSFMGFWGGSVSWFPPAWNTIDEHGQDQRTPDLKDIVQDIVNRDGWSSGNAMSFIITGSGKRVAESYDGESGASPLLHIEYMGCPEEEDNTTTTNIDENSTAICYALTDDSDKLYKVSMLPNGDPLPIASSISIATNFNGEGSAYRASNNKFYAFKGQSDDHGPSDLYTIDVDTGTTTKIVDDIISGAVDGAEFYYDPILKKEVLYIISGETNSKLYAFNPDNWQSLDGYPKETNTNLSSLAINPITGEAYAIDDYNYDNKKPKVYKLNLKTGTTINITTLQHLADAEGLAFASDGNLYIEDEGRDDLSGKRLYMVNLETGELIPSAITNSNGDIEGLSCNGTQIAIDYPTIKIDNNSSIVEGNISTSTLNFLVTLSKPAVDNVTFTYKVTDITAKLDEDYILDNNLTVVIPKGVTSATIPIYIKGDFEIESDEQFSIDIVDAKNAIVDTSSMIGTIINDDQKIKVSIYDANITEGDEGTKELFFNISLDRPAINGGLTIQLEPLNISAIEGEDFTRHTSSVYIAEGESNQTIYYLINGDTDIENNETFLVKILENDSYSIDQIHKEAIGTIINDDENETYDLIAEYRFDECPLDLTDEIEDHTPYRHRHRVRNGFTTRGDIAKINRSGEFRREEHQYTEGEDGLDDIFGNESDEFTITAWIYPTSLISDKTNHNTENTIFAKASDSKNDNIEIGINSNGTLHLYLDTLSKDRYADFGEAGDITTNSWHFIGISYKYGEVTVLIDDKIYTDTSTWAGAINIDKAIGSPVTIGASLHIDNYFDGYIDEFKIFRNQIRATTMNQFRERERNGKNWDDTTREEVVCTEASPVGCIMSAFMFQNKPTDINILNLTNGEMTSLKENISNDNINAIGFNKKDGYFWGYNYTKQNGTVTRIGMNSQGDWVTEDFLVDGLDGFKSYVGDIDNNGNLYLKESGSSRRVVVIDLDKNSSNYLKKIKDFNLDFDLDTADWGFNARDNMLYAVNNGSTNKYLYKIDPSTGHQISRENTLLTGDRGFGASFFDANGFYYVYDNHTGNIYRIDVANSAKAILFSTGNIVSLNDGAMCTDAEFKFDFGDLPDSYPTTLESNGARHSLPTYGEPTIYLGRGVSNENNGKPSSNANLDENDDGVEINNSPLQDKIIDAGTTNTFKITTHGEAFLSAWIDWNGDGDFDDSNEQIATNLNGSSGEIIFSVIVPSSAIDITTYARFRYSYQKDLTPTGSAIDGEVEDYKINIHGNLEPFTCSDRLYLSNRTELGIEGGDSGATWLHSFYAMTPAFVPFGDGFASVDGGYNAIGYNVKDNFIYALYGNELLKIDRNANIKNLGAIDGLPDTQLYAGEFDRDGYYFVTGNGSDDNKMYKIDIEQKKVIKTITLSNSIKFWDMAIDTTNQYFYAMLVKDGGDDFVNDKFVKINKDSGDITVLGDDFSNVNSYISLIFADKNGKVIAIANNKGMYELSPSTGLIYWINATPELSYYNDGTNCPNASFILPPRMPRLSIGDVTKAEGDSGESNFNFKVSIDADLPIIPMGMPAIFFYKVIDGNGNEITPPHGVALQSDHDFKGGNGIGINMNIFSDKREMTISVPVYGDENIEKDEEFFVDIYFPDFFPTNFCMIGKSRGVGVILNDDMKFNIIRSNAEKDDLLIYTQIAGRDFDYSIVSDSIIDDITVKVELINNSSGHILYTGYKYIENGDRIDVKLDNDLSILTATKDASFKVYFLKDENGTISHGNYANQDSYNNVANRVGYSQISQDASQHFSIRPAGYKISIEDIDENNKTIIYKDSTDSKTKSLDLASGYDYRLEAQAIAYDTNHSMTEGYSTTNGDLNVTLIFKDKSSCYDTSSPQISNYIFNNGSLLNNLSHNNVGEYLLRIEDKVWSKDDGDKGACILNSSLISNSGDEKSGCNISSNSLEDYNEIYMKFHPYIFSIDAIVQNRPNNGKDYVYMNDLNKSLDMGLDIISYITAIGKKSTKLTNFTKSCEATDMTLSLDYNITTDSIVNQKTYNEINTTKGSKVVFKRVFGFNGVNLNIADVKNSHLDNNITILSDEFLDINEGNSSVEILYNLSKNLSEPINPIKISFNHLDINSTDTSKIKNIDRVANGVGIIDNIKRLYYSQVAPDVENYPDEYEGVITTPISVLIYCNHTKAWCSDMIEDNGLNNIKTKEGWYTALLHDSNIEGGVIKFLLDNPLCAVNPKASKLPNFELGKISTLKTGYSGNKFPAEVEVNMEVSPWLEYNSDPSRDGIPFWRNTFRDRNATWSGEGEAGNQIEIKTTTRPAKKIFW